MKTYIIKEIQNVNSEREGVTIEAADLSQAKRKASRNQTFKGTTLRIETINGACLSYKESGSKWVDTF